MLSTRTTSSRHDHEPPGSLTPARSRCTPSLHVRVSKAARSAPPEQGTVRVKSRRGWTACTARPSSSTRSDADARRVAGVGRDHGAPAQPAVGQRPRPGRARAPSGSESVTRTFRSPMNARSRSRRQYDATQRTSVASRDVDSPRTSSCTQCPTDVEQRVPAPQPALGGRVLQPRLPARVAQQPRVERDAGDRGPGRRVEPPASRGARCGEPRPHHVACVQALPGDAPRGVDPARARRVRDRAGAN